MRCDLVHYSILPPPLPLLPIQQLKKTPGIVSAVDCELDRKVLLLKELGFTRDQLGKCTDILLIWVLKMVSVYGHREAHHIWALGSTPYVGIVASTCMYIHCFLIWGRKECTHPPPVKMQMHAHIPHTCTRCIHTKFTYPYTHLRPTCMHACSKHLHTHTGAFIAKMPGFLVQMSVQDVEQRMR